MADNKTENLVSKPPLQVKIVDDNGLMNRAWSVWFRDLYRRVAYKGGNSIDENIEDIDDLVKVVEASAKAIAENRRLIELNISAIADNTSDIEANRQSILVNSQAITQNTIDIEANVQAIISLSQAVDVHVSSSEAHGSNGDIVGFNDAALETTLGLVKRMAAIEFASETSVSIVTPDIGTAPLAYDQAYTQSVTNLANESKAAINQLALDLNDAISVLNNLLAESKTSGQMTNT